MNVTDEMVRAAQSVTPRLYGLTDAEMYRALVAALAVVETEGRQTAGNPVVPSKSLVREDASANAGISDKALIREIAMDIGKATVEHIEVMYPAALEAVARTARLSIRNCVHNEIISALDTVDYDAIRARLDHRKRERRRQLAFIRGVRKEDARNG